MVNDSADTKSELFAIRSLSRQKPQNPHVIRVFEFWFHRNEEEGILRTFILMELCDGNLEEYVTSLRDADKEIEPLEIIDIMLQVLSGLCHCHEAEICHRDLKLSNSPYLFSFF